MSITRQSRCGLLPLGFTAVCLASAAQAQTPAAAGAAATATTELPAVVVTASRTDATAQSIPGGVTLVTSDDIRAAGAQNVVEALDKLGGVLVRSTSGNPAQSEVSLRGFGENSHGRVLVLRDGQRLNSPDMAGINWLQIPLGEIERIEILRGGQSVLYGDHALAGVINIVTRAGAEEPTSSITALAASDDTFGVHATTDGARDGILYSANLDHEQSDGYRDNGGYEGFDARALVGRDWGEGRRATISAAYDDVDYGLPGYLTPEQVEQDRRQTVTPDDEARSRNWNVNAALGLGRSDDGRVDLNAVYSRKDMESDFVSYGSIVDSVIDSAAFTPRYAASTEWFGRDNRLLLGADLYLDSLAADRFADASRAARTLSGDITKTSAGAYLRDEVDAAETVTLGLGGRVDRARYDAEVDQPGAGAVVDDAATHDETATEASLLYRPTDDARLFARAATVFRYPFLDEQVSYYGFGMDRFYQDLEPEEGFNLETGGSAALAPEWKAELTLFHLQMRDEIAYNPLTGVNENTDDTRRQGAETGLEWSRPQTARTGLFYTFTDSRYTSGPNDGNTVPLVPDNLVTLRGELSLPADLAALAAVKWVDEQYLGGDYDNTRDKLDAYATLDVALRYAHAERPAVQLLAGVDNVFDEEYASVGYVGLDTDGYYPAPGRTYKAGASWRF